MAEELHGNRIGFPIAAGPPAFTAGIAAGLCEGIHAGQAV